MHVLTGHTVAGTKSDDPCAQLTLLALEALGVVLLGRQLRKEALDKRRYRRVAFGRLDAGAAVGLVVYGYCDIFHIHTVSQRLKCRQFPFDAWKLAGSPGSPSHARREEDTTPDEREKYTYVRRA